MGDETDARKLRDKTMKVREFIEKLKQLDQEEDIWVFDNETEWKEPEVETNEFYAKYGYKYIIY